MVKPYRTVTYYSQANQLKKKLTELGIEFVCKDVFSEFWGTRFDISKPKGKGSTDKCRIINEL